MLQPQPEKRVNTDEILNLEQLERNAIEQMCIRDSLSTARRLAMRQRLITDFLSIFVKTKADAAS